MYHVHIHIRVWFRSFVSLSGWGHYSKTRDKVKHLLAKKMQKKASVFSRWPCRYARQDLNLRPRDYESHALPLSYRRVCYYCIRYTDSYSKKGVFFGIRKCNTCSYSVWVEYGAPCRDLNPGALPRSRNACPPVDFTCHGDMDAAGRTRTCSSWPPRFGQSASILRLFCARVCPPRAGYAHYPCFCRRLTA